MHTDLALTNTLDNIRPEADRVPVAGGLMLKTISHCKFILENAVLYFCLDDHLAIPRYFIPEVKNPKFSLMKTVISTLFWVVRYIPWFFHHLVTFNEKVAHGAPVGDSHKPLKLRSCAGGGELHMITLCFYTSLQQGDSFGSLPLSTWRT